MDKKGDGHTAEVISLFKKGYDVGVISESGVPAVADPGFDIVRSAHEHSYSVKPLVGPSSIILALSASGLNGNSFTFHGYLPIKEVELKAKLRSIESRVNKEQQTQIFIETPYRNNRIVRAILKHIQNTQISLCIAMDITGDKELIRTKTIHHWKQSFEDLPKLPAIFLLG